MPLNGTNRKSDFKAILDKIQACYQGWKGKLLNKARRLTLVQCNLSTIPLYTMQTCWLTSGVCDTIDKYCHDFLWQSNDDKGIRLWNWESVCSPKNTRGLGLRMAPDNNIAMMGRLVWSLAKEDKKFWVNVLLGKYLRNGSILNRHVPSSVSPVRSEGNSKSDPFLKTWFHMEGGKS